MRTNQPKGQKMTAEKKPQDLRDAWDAERLPKIEADIVIAKDRRTWSVISLSGYYMREPKPEVLQSGLTTLEAAEACRKCHINNAMDDALYSHPYHPGSGVSLEWFNTRGIVEAVLKAECVPGDTSNIAFRIADALERGSLPAERNSCDPEIPF